MPDRRGHFAGRASRNFQLPSSSAFRDCVRTLRSRGSSSRAERGQRCRAECAAAARTILRRCELSATANTRTEGNMLRGSNRAWSWIRCATRRKRITSHLAPIHRRIAVARSAA